MIISCLPFRSDIHGLDEVCSAVQGGLAAAAVNLVAGAPLISPALSAIGFAGVVLAQKIYLPLMKRIIPDMVVGDRMIRNVNDALRYQKIASYAFAIFTICLGMQLTGLFVCPNLLLILGILCTVEVILLSIIPHLINRYAKTATEEEIKQFFSQVEKMQDLPFQKFWVRFEGKLIKLRICYKGNTHQEMHITLDTGEKISCKTPYHISYFNESCEALVKKYITQNLGLTIQPTSSNE